MTQPLLGISNLSAVSLREAGRPILRDVSLQVMPGEVLGLLGESGAGKSTIAKALLDILPRTVGITQGEIHFEGQDLLALPKPALRRIIGAQITLIPQDPQTGLNPGRRIGVQVTDGLRLRRGLSARAAQQQALALLQEVQIRDAERVLRCYPHELSGGMRQRVLIAAAFAMEPKLVIADEPTTALDVTVQRQILRLVRGLQAAHQTAVIFVTHDLGVAAQICDQLAILYAGKVIENGPTAAVLARPKHAYTAALLAASPRYDQPEAGLQPVQAAVLAQLRAELTSDQGVAAHD